MRKIWSRDGRSRKTICAADFKSFVLKVSLDIILYMLNNMLWKYLTLLGQKGKLIKGLNGGSTYA